MTCRPRWMTRRGRAGRPDGRARDTTAAPMSFGRARKHVGRARRHDGRAGRHAGWNGGRAVEAAAAPRSDDRAG